MQLFGHLLRQELDDPVAEQGSGRPDVEGRDAVVVGIACSIRRGEPGGGADRRIVTFAARLGGDHAAGSTAGGHHAEACQRRSVRQPCHPDAVEAVERSVKEPRAGLEELLEAHLTGGDRARFEMAAFEREGRPLRQIDHGKLRHGRVRAGSRLHAAGRVRVDGDIRSGSAMGGEGPKREGKASRK